MELGYEKAGLRAGIEIHQQLDTHKLFCECPSILRQDEPDIVVKRHLYAPAGETGKIDIAAAYEQSKKKLTFMKPTAIRHACLNLMKSPRTSSIKKL